MKQDRTSKEQEKPFFEGLEPRLLLSSTVVDDLQALGIGLDTLANSNWLDSTVFDMPLLGPSITDLLRGPESEPDADPTGAIGLLLQNGLGQYLPSELEGGVNITSYETLRQRLDDLDNVPGNVTLTIPKSGGPADAERVRYGVVVSKTLTGLAETEATLGSLSLGGEISTSAMVTLSIAFGVDSQGEFFIEDAAAGTPELVVSSLSGSFTGEVAFNLLELPVEMASAKVVTDNDVKLSIDIYSAANPYSATLTGNSIEPDVVFSITPTSDISCLEGQTVTVTWKDITSASNLVVAGSDVYFDVANGMSAAIQEGLDAVESMGKGILAEFHTEVPGLGKTISEFVGTAGGGGLLAEKLVEPITEYLNTATSPTIEGIRQAINDPAGDGTMDALGELTASFEEGALRFEYTAINWWRQEVIPFDFSTVSGVTLTPESVNVTATAVMDLRLSFSVDPSELPDSSSVRSDYGNAFFVEVNEFSAGVWATATGVSLGDGVTVGGKDLTSDDTNGRESTFVLGCKASAQINNGEGQVFLSAMDSITVDPTLAGTLSVTLPVAASPPVPNSIGNNLRLAITDEDIFDTATPVLSLEVGLNKDMHDAIFDALTELDNIADEVTNSKAMTTPLPLIDQTLKELVLGESVEGATDDPGSVFGQYAKVAESYFKDPNVGPLTVSGFVRYMTTHLPSTASDVLFGEAGGGTITITSLLDLPNETLVFTVTAMATHELELGASLDDLLRPFGIEVTNDMLDGATTKLDFITEFSFGLNLADKTSSHKLTKLEMSAEMDAELAGLLVNMGLIKGSIADNDKNVVHLKAGVSYDTTAPADPIEICDLNATLPIEFSVPGTPNTALGTVTVTSVNDIANVTNPITLGNFILDVQFEFDGLNHLAAFGNLMPDGVASTLADLEQVFQQLGDAASDIPFVDTSLDDVFDFATTFSNIIRNDDGTLKPSPGTLDALLDELGDSLKASDTDVTMTYSDDVLLFTGLGFESKNSRTFPLNFAIDMSPLGDLDVDSKIDLNASGAVAFDLGFELSLESGFRPFIENFSVTGEVTGDVSSTPQGAFGTAMFGPARIMIGGVEGMVNGVPTTEDTGHVLFAELAISQTEPLYLSDISTATTGAPDPAAQDGSLDLPNKLTLPTPTITGRAKLALTNISVESPISISGGRVEIEIEDIAATGSDDYVAKVTTSGMGTLANMKPFNEVVDGVINAVEMVQTKLEDAAALGNTPLPLINRSLNELVMSDFSAKFSAALEAMKADPAGSLQEVASMIAYALHIGIDNVDVAAVDDSLRIEFVFTQEFAKDFAFDMEIEGKRFADAGGSAKMRFEGDATLTAALQISLNENATSLQGTSIEIRAGLAKENLNFSAAYHSLGVFVKDGSASIGGANSEKASFRIDLAPTDSGTLTMSAQGTAKATLPIYFPTNELLIGNMTIDVDLSTGKVTIEQSDNFGTLPFTGSLITLLENPGMIVDGLDMALGQIQNGLDSLVTGAEIPLLGPAMSDSAQFIKGFREGLLGGIRKAVGKTNVVDFIRSELCTLFSNMGILKDGPDNDNFVTEEDITVTYTDANGAAAVPTNATNVQFNFSLGQETAIGLIEANEPINLGLPNLSLQLSLDEKVEMTAGWNFNFGFGLNVDNGFYFDTSDEEEVTVSLAVNDQGVLESKGQVGKLLGVIAETSFKGLGVEFGLNLSDEQETGRLYLTELASSGMKTTPLFTPTVDVEFGMTLGAYDAKKGVSTEASFPQFFATLQLGVDDTGKPTIAFNDVQLDLGVFMSKFAQPLLAKVSDLIDPIRPVIEMLSTPIPGMKDLLGSAKEVTLLDLPNALIDSGLSSAYSPVRGHMEGVLVYVETFNQVAGIIQTVMDAISEIDNFDPNQSMVRDFGSFIVGASGRAEISGDASASPASNGNSGPTQVAAGDVSTTKSTKTKVSPADNSKTKSAMDKFIGESAVSFPFLTNPEDVFNLILGQETDLFTFQSPVLDIDLIIDFCMEFPPKSLGLSSPLSAAIDLDGHFKGRAGIGMGFDTSGLLKSLDSGKPLDVFDGFYFSDRVNANGEGEDVDEFFLDVGLSLSASREVYAARISGSGMIEVSASVDLNDPNNDGKLRISEMVHLITIADHPAEGLLNIFNIEAGFEAGIRVKLDIRKLKAKWKTRKVKLWTPWGTETIKIRYISKVISTWSNLFDTGGHTVKFSWDHVSPTPEAPVLASLQANDTLLLHMGPQAGNRITGNVMDGDEEFTVTQTSDGTVEVEAFDITQTFSGVKAIQANGGKGHDTIRLIGLQMPAEIDGGNGDDLLTADASDESDSLEVLPCQGRIVFYGGVGFDTIVGGLGDDTIFGGLGDDTMFGGAGADTLRGGDGRDTIHGGDGADEIYGGSGMDTIHGDAGDDMLYGEMDIDTLYGGADNDTLDGGQGGDALDGGDGDDTFHFEDDFGLDTVVEEESGGVDQMDFSQVTHSLSVEFSSIHVSDGAGGEVTHSKNHIETVRGSSADDQFVFADGTGVSGRLDGGGGTDTLDYSAYTTDVSVNLLTGQATGAGIGVANFANITGGAGNDSLTGDDGDNVLVGNLGDDLLVGLNGHDTLDGGSGSDQADGGEGNDVYIQWAEGRDVIVDSAGTDMIDFSANHAGIRLNLARNTGQRQNIRRGTLAIFGVLEDAMGSDYKDVIKGNHVGNVIFGGKGNDRLFGQDGNDFLLGGLGKDRLWGGQGNDQMDGGEGNDRLLGQNGDDLLLGGLGKDRLWGGKDNDRLAGNEGDDRLSGQDGDDLLLGGLGEDRLWGGRDNDRLAGNDGDDRLSGQDGDDLLLGGLGEDRLLGSRGNNQLHENGSDLKLFGDPDTDAIHVELDRTDFGIGRRFWTFLSSVVT